MPVTFSSWTGVMMEPWGKSLHLTGIDPFTCLFPVAAYSKTTFRDAWLFALGAEVKDKLWKLSLFTRAKRQGEKCAQTPEGRMQASVAKFLHPHPGTPA